MTNLTTIQTTDLINILESNMNTPYETALENGTITDTQVRSLRGAIASTLIRKDLCNPKQAVVIGMAYSQTINDLMYSIDTWVENVIALCDDVTIQNVDSNEYEVVTAVDVIDLLVAIGFVSVVDGIHSVGESAIRILNMDTKSQYPIEAAVGINSSNRLHNYGVKANHISPLVKKAIHILETTESTKSVIMEEIAVGVFNHYKDLDTSVATKLMSQAYVLQGVNNLDEDVKYVTEFKAGRRFRLYQAACHGYNGQSSDLARSLQDLGDVDMNYNVKETLEILLEEIADMTSLTGAMLNKAMEFASSEPVRFIIKVLDNVNSKIKKPWNFVKFSKLVTEIRNGNKPYIGVAVGYDAKCSGPQLGALMTNEIALLKATGFSTKGSNLDDAYQIAIKHVIDAGLPELTRSDMKKPFMAIFYGAGKDAMLDAKTIEFGAHSKLYKEEWYFNGELQGQYREEASKVADMFHKAVSASFGKNLSKLRTKIKTSGGTTKDNVFTSYLDNIIEHTMPCGAVVSMDYREELDIDGELIVGKETPKSVSISMGGDTEILRNVRFKTNNYDLQSFARTGFVNMIQATDALMARLIVVHARELGIQNIVSIHDCFRVDINNTKLLKQAIMNAYNELFGSKTNEPTANMPHSLDIIKEYFVGVENATKEEFKSEYTGGQFYRKTNIRVCNNIAGESITSLIDALVADDNTYYFDK